MLKQLKSIVGIIIIIWLLKQIRFLIENRKMSDK